MTASTRPDVAGANWFREEYERARVRNAMLPAHARMIVTNPCLSRDHNHPHCMCEAQR